MARNKYTINELVLVDQLLQTVPRTKTGGVLPYEEFKKTSQWTTLVKNHSEESVTGTLQRYWRKSLIPIEPPKAPTSKLNHAYNFCPGCGMPLNT